MGNWTSEEKGFLLAETLVIMDKMRFQNIASSHIPWKKIAIEALWVQRRCWRPDDRSGSKTFQAIEATKNWTVLKKKTLISNILKTILRYCQSNKTFHYREGWGASTAQTCACRSSRGQMDRMKTGETLSRENESQSHFVTLWNRQNWEKCRQVFYEDEQRPEKVVKTPKHTQAKLSYGTGHAPARGKRTAGIANCYQWWNGTVTGGLCHLEPTKSFATLPFCAHEQL